MRRRREPSGERPAYAQYEPRGEAAAPVRERVGNWNGLTACR
jgi:hypothetical protein